MIISHLFPQFIEMLNCAILVYRVRQWNAPPPLRKRGENKHHPGRARCSQQQGLRSISPHFLWGVSLTDLVLPSTKKMPMMQHVTLPIIFWTLLSTIGNSCCKKIWGRGSSFLFCQNFSVYECIMLNPNFPVKYNLAWHSQLTKTNMCSNGKGVSSF